jgi:hypothetical protein
MSSRPNLPAISGSTAMVLPEMRARSLSASHYLRRAEEVRGMAKSCGDPKLRALLHDIANVYEELASP